MARHFQDIPQYEETLVAGLKKYVQPGDRVVVVGGGWGITATVAALRAGPTGHVTCFEADAEGCERVRRTAERNGVSDRMSISHVPGISDFVANYNHCRYHESLGNLTPADVYFGRGHTIIIERERIKRQTIATRRLLHRQRAA